MTIDYIIAGLLMTVILAVCTWFYRQGRKETARRAALSIDVRKQLEQDDAIAMQRYGF